MTVIQVLAVHGIGHQEADLQWQARWKASITSALTARRNVGVEVAFTKYDAVFERRKINPVLVLEALARLTKSGLFYGALDLARNRRSLDGQLEKVRWTAGMVAQWTADEVVRRRTRDQVLKDIARQRPDVIVAHSLGSLIVYDALKRVEGTRAAPDLSATTVVTCGSQIGNPFVRAQFGGRVEELQDARFWWHLFNEHDDIFTTPLNLPGRQRFQQVETAFNLDGFGDHDATGYLDHAETKRLVWSDIALVQPNGAPRGRAMAPSRRLEGAARKARTESARKRALLVGIADYPQQIDRLEGPVNDVFRMSATLQEYGFRPDDIRVVLNERATAAGIRERLRWLLADANRGDTMVFHFAGHGAQIPGYGVDAEVDHIDECLVPYDFDWTLDNAITDDELCGLYGQLPYESTFVALLDCCHSGGLTRAGAQRARGLTPPDDVRHRALRWDADNHMWVPRHAKYAKSDSRTRNAGDGKKWLGESGRVRRVGTGTALWAGTAKDFQAKRAAYGHKGAYQPILLQACAENESAYEYRDGAASYGAFTYAITAQLLGKDGKASLTYPDLLKAAAKCVDTVVEDPQHPQLVMPRRRKREIALSTKSGRR